jgi:hypothetical protein
MKNNMNFDAHNCFERICSTDKIASVGEYKFCRVSGISYMEEMIRKFKTAKAYFCIDDTEDGNLFQSGGGYMEWRQYTVFLLKKFPFGNMDVQHEVLNECRRIYRQIMKKPIRDRRLLANEMTCPVIERIPFYEIPGYFISGCTGLYFSISVDIPTELCYDGNGWIQSGV